MSWCLVRPYHPIGLPQQSSTTFGQPLQLGPIDISQLLLATSMSFGGGWFLVTLAGVAFGLPSLFSSCITLGALIELMGGITVSPSNSSSVVIIMVDSKTSLILESLDKCRTTFEVLLHWASCSGLRARLFFAMAFLPQPDYVSTAECFHLVALLLTPTVSQKLANRGGIWYSMKTRGKVACARKCESLKPRSSFFS